MSAKDLTQRIATAWVEKTSSDFVQSWTKRIDQESEDFDLTDPEDRASFRTRVLKAFETLKFSAMLELATALRAKPRDRSRAAVARAIADVWVARG